MRAKCDGTFVWAQVKCLASQFFILNQTQIHNTSTLAAAAANHRTGAHTPGFLCPVFASTVHFERTGGQLGSAAPLLHCQLQMNRCPGGGCGTKG